MAMEPVSVKILGRTVEARKVGNKPLAYFVDDQEVAREDALAVVKILRAAKGNQPEWVPHRQEVP